MRSVYDYFQQALHRTTAPAGTRVFDADGNCAAFSVTFLRGRVDAVTYQCTSCVTLVALCEHLAELATGSTPHECWKLSADNLLALHPEIPKWRRDRSRLAIRAFHATLDESL